MIPREGLACQEDYHLCTKASRIKNLAIDGYKSPWEGDALERDRRREARSGTNTGFGVFPGAGAGFNFAGSGPGCATRLTRARIEGDFMGFILSREERHCPRCGSHSVRRSRRRGAMERMVCALLGVSPFRCDECDHRYFRFGRVRRTEEHRPA